MKVLTFYSYKGGVGRTFSLANLAVCLSRLGRRVVLLDFDFDAPGLPSKFGKSSFKDISEGIVDYIWDFIAEGTVAKPIKELCVSVGIKNSGENNGTICLIPTGNAGSNEKYWDRISSMDWANLFNLELDAEWKIKFFLDMKTEIEQFTPSPDYLLVDARAGITEYGGVSILLWADTVVCFFGNNRENFDGLRDILKGLNGIEDKRRDLKIHKPLTIVPVLTRIPPYLDDMIRPNLVNEVKKNLGLDHIHVLHSDWDLELEETLRLDLSGKAEDVLLLREYLNLFHQLCPQEIAVKEKPPLESWWKALNLKGSATEVDRIYRVFSFRPSMGTMINLSDNERNVSFKVETFCGMLSDIHKSLISKVTLEKPYDGEEIEQEFFEAGKICGKNFGKSLVEKVWKDDYPFLSPKKKLDRWCEFDSSVGFGKLSEYIDDSEMAGGNTIASGRIVVRENFLAGGREEEEADLCSLLRGYIEGVMEEIIDPNVTVSHRPEDCMRGHPEREECVFSFEISSIQQDTESTKTSPTEKE